LKKTEQVGDVEKMSKWLMLILFISCVVVSFRFVCYMFMALEKWMAILVVLIHDNNQDKFVCLPMTIFCNGEIQ